MGTTTQLMGKVALLMTEQNAGLVIHAHEQDLHSIHSLQGSMCANTSKSVLETACLYL